MDPLGEGQPSRGGDGMRGEGPVDGHPQPRRNDCQCGHAPVGRLSGSGAPWDARVGVVV